MFAFAISRLRAAQNINHTAIVHLSYTHSTTKILSFLFLPALSCPDFSNAWANGLLTTKGLGVFPRGWPLGTRLCGAKRSVRSVSVAVKIALH